MTAQLPSKERLQEIIDVDARCNPEVRALAEFALAAHEQEPVGIVHGVAKTLDGSNFVAMVECKTRLSDGTELFSHPAPVPAVPECFERLLAHAQGIAMGVDWNKGTAATHHRDKLCQAVKDCAAMLNGGKS